MARKNNISAEIAAMKVGQTLSYPAERCNTIQSVASMSGFKYNRRYSTSIHREERIITVTREK